MGANLFVRFFRWIGYRYLLVAAWYTDRNRLVAEFRTAKDVADGRHAREVEALRDELAIRAKQIEFLTAANSKMFAVVERDTASLQRQAADAIHSPTPPANPSWQQP